MPIEGVEEVKSPSLDGMSQSDLENILKSDDNALANAIGDGSLKEGVELPEAQEGVELPFTPTPKENKVEPKPVAPSPTASQYKYEIDVGDNRKYQFKTEDEFKQSFINAQKVISELNGKYGSANQQLARMRQLEDSYNSAQRQIEELRRGTQQIASGQQPTAISQSTVDDLGLGDEFFNSLTTDNFSEKFSEVIKNVAKTIDNKYDTRYKEVERKNKALEDQLGKISGDLTYKEGMLNFEAHRNNLFSEVNKLQDDPITGGSLKTQWPVDKINDCIIQYGDLAAAMLPPGDYDKFAHLNEVLKMYCPVDQDGDIDISRRQMKSIRAAFAAYNIDANLNASDLASAHANGQSQVLDVVSRIANQPPTLPNTVSNPNGLNDMTVEEATRIINTDPMTVKKWEKSAPKKFKKYMKAQELISNLT